MNLNVVLEVVISLMVLYWLLSVFCSHLVEALNSFFNVRAKALERFILEMVYGDDGPGSLTVEGLWRRGWALVQRWLVGAQVTAERDHRGLDLLRHALIATLSKPRVRADGPSTAPSYVPAGNFARALLGRLARHGEALVAQELDRGVQATLASAGAGAQVQSLATRLLSAPASTPMSQDELREGLQRAGADTALQEVLLPALLRLQEVKADAFLAVEQALLLAGDQVSQRLREALMPLIADANHDLERLRTGIEQWYDSVMDRASGWFKRRSTTLLAATALPISLAFGLDSIGIARDLAQQPQLRQSMIGLAGVVVEAGPVESGTVARRLALAWSADRLRWTERADQDAQLADVAGEVMPLLLRHASLTASILLATSPRDQAAAFAAGEREALAGEICRRQAAAQAGVEATAPTASEAPPDDRSRRLQHCAAEWRSTAEAVLDAPDRVALARGLARSEQVFWRPSLASAIVELRLGAGSAASATARDTFRRELSDAVRYSRELGVSQHDFFSALRSVQPIWAMVSGMAWCSPAAWGRLLSWLLGCLLTAIMVSLGAPFWYDLLTKLVNQRGTGPRPASTTSPA